MKNNLIFNFLMKIGEKDAIIVVDVQRDFCPGGALPVPDGDKVVPVINSLLPYFKTVVFTRDWHPPDHISFSEAPQFKDGSWPPHCVAGSPGAEFHPELKVPPQAIIISKATERDKEAYSGFEGTELDEILKKRGIKRLFVCGLATDYCVKNTALDGVKLGYEVFVIEDASRGVDAPPGNLAKAIQEMRSAGVKFIRSHEIHG